MVMAFNKLITLFGFLGNVVSLGMFLSPVPTFYEIYQRKSSEGYQPVTYAVALFSAMLMLYYGFLKTEGFWLITINSFGCAIEVLYLVTCLLYAPKKTKIFTMKLLLLFNVGACGSVIVLTSFLAKGSKKIVIVGWINVITNICVFVAPLSVMRQVLRTRSVEFMPISLSFFLTVNATMWFFYGYLIHDFFIGVPNILGFFLGTAQMILYLIYKSPSSKAERSSTSHDTSNDSHLNTADNTSDNTQQTELRIVGNAVQTSIV